MPCYAWRERGRYPCPGVILNGNINIDGAKTQLKERGDIHAEKEIPAQGHRPLQGRLLAVVPGET
jgi:hypothetical protein